MKPAKLNLMILLTLVLVVPASGGVVSLAQAAPIDVTSPVGPGPVGIVVFLPALGVAPAVPPSPFLLTPNGGLMPILPRPSISPSSPALPSILLLTPTPATGSLVVPLRVPLAGPGPSLTQLQLVIPGPNPSQNTTVNLEQLLNLLIRSTQAAANPGTSAPPLVNVFTTPSR